MQRAANGGARLGDRRFSPETTRDGFSRGKKSVSSQGAARRAANHRRLEMKNMVRRMVVWLVMVQIGGSLGALADTATNKFSAPDLMVLLNWRDAGKIDNDALVSMVGHQGVSFKLDVDTILELSTNASVGKAGLEKIEAFLSSLPGPAGAGSKTAGTTTAPTSTTTPTNVAPKLDTSTAAKLPTLTTNAVALATNLTVVGLNVAGVGGNITLKGTDSTLLGTNTTAFGTNLTELGDSLASLGTNLLAQNKPPSIPYQAFISVGSEFVNPYGISVVNPTPGSKGVLTNAGNSTVGYVEFDYINRHVLRSFGRDQVTGNWFGGSFVCPVTQAPDVQFSMGFLFDNGTTITNGQTYSAQILAGADYYSQLTLGFPIWRLDKPGQSHQISLEASGGVATEKSFEEVHPNAFAGLAYETSFNPMLLTSATNNCGFFMAKAGAGWIDVPSLVGSNNAVNLDNNGTPIFDLKPNWQLGAYLAYPLTSKLYLTVEANDYLGGKPDSWNVKVGASIPLDGLSATFSSLIKSVGGSP
jgi:hypothetical protein